MHVIAQIYFVHTNRSMLIKDFYHKTIYTVLPDVTVGEVLNLMIQNHHNAFLVVDAQEFPVGILTIQDILGAIVPHEFVDNRNLAQAMYHEEFFDERVNAIKEKRVEEIMKKDFLTIELSSNTMALMADFLQHDTYFVPVMEHGKVVGVISRSNVKKAIAQAMGIRYIPKHENDQ